MDHVCEKPSEIQCMETKLLDFSHPNIEKLVQTKGWRNQVVYQRIGSVYDYVRNEIAFGYNMADDLPASQILKDGFGQCNTKATLLMTLFRAVGVPCRLHGFTIHKSLQRGVVPEFFYAIAPDDILHSWVEIYFDNRWINLEGFILDDKYLSRLQDKFGSAESLCGFGAGSNSLMTPEVSWQGKDTYIQKTGINNDLGIYASPDLFYKKYQQDMSFMKKKLYQYMIRHMMNRRVAKIRQGWFPKSPVKGATAPSPQQVMGDRS